MKQERHKITQKREQLVMSLLRYSRRLFQTAKPEKPKRCLVTLG